jgi:glycosyltransferase involved in cell wall biosynthesis
VLKGARIHLIRGSGVDTARFSPDPQRRFDRTPVSILFASRLLWEKGLAELIEATRMLSERRVSAVVRIAGEPDPGNPSAVSRATLEQWRALPNVELLGHRDDIDRLLAQADIVVLPSYREGTPRILLEAAAAGLPLVATDVPGCREVVRADENGILVPVGDAKALAGALERLALDPAARERMSARSREIACGDFDEDRVLAATLAIYRI